MSNTMWWYVMRSAGLTSWFFLTLTLMWGTVASGRLLPNAKGRRWIVDLHPFLGAIGLGALALHIVAAVADTTVGLTWMDTVVPFTSSWHPWGIAAGVVALWMLVVVQVTSMLRRQLGKTTWHRIHLVSYAMAWITALHAVANGSDLNNRLVAWSALGLMVTATGLALWRLLYPNGPREVVPAGTRVGRPAAAAEPSVPTYVARSPRPSTTLPSIPPASPPESPAVLVPSGAPGDDGWR